MPRKETTKTAAAKSASAEPRRRNFARRAAILAAAAALLKEQGYASVTIEGVAARAGVGKQTIYRWWSGKIELYIELYDEIAKTNLKDFRGGSLAADLAAYANGLYAQLTHPIASLTFKGMVAEAQGSAASRNLFQAFMSQRFTITRNIVKRAIARGEVQPTTDVDAVSSLIGGAVVWRLLLADRPLDPAFITFIYQTTLAGLTSQAAKT